MSEVVSKLRKPLVTKERNYTEVSDDVLGPIERPPGKLWKIGITISSLVLLMGIFVVGYQLKTGIGTWGLNKTIGWSWDITNFVFWVGIGHAGTLISAILFLLRQKWRTSINRAAEAMTIFAVMCAGVYPIIHMGRPWLAYWVFPYPNTRSLWLNFRSPLLWDVFAISTYFLVSAVFWYIGLIPDIANMRDRATEGSLKKKIYTFFSLGWNGSHRTWHRYEMLCMILAGLATPLVVSVHTIVSMDFATSVIPGWHTTIFPPYFVAGAVFSGFAMVLTLLIILRKVMNFEHFITMGHIEAMCKVIICTGMIVGLAYGTEFFIAWYSGNQYERFVFLNRAFGPYAWAYWSMVTCNVVIPQIFWFKKIRNNLVIVFIVSIFVNIGMWFERFVIITTSLHRDFLPSSWAMFSPTWVEICTFIGSFGLFFTMFFLFVRFLPAVAISEVKTVLNFAKHKKH
ncbi:MAG: NrfD/PsrC family molybdoenzyme membrane anchor subunit [Bacteriovoracaceae bacterium]